MERGERSTEAERVTEWKSKREKEKKITRVEGKRERERTRKGGGRKEPREKYEGERLQQQYPLYL